MKHTWKSTARCAQNFGERLSRYKAVARSHTRLAKRWFSKEDSIFVVDYPDCRQLAETKQSTKSTTPAHEKETK